MAIHFGDYLKHYKPFSVIQGEISRQKRVKHRRDEEEADRQGQIQNLKDLLEVLEAGDVETACQWVRAAIRKLEEG